MVNEGNKVVDHKFHCNLDAFASSSKSVHREKKWYAFWQSLHDKGILGGLLALCTAALRVATFSEAK